MGAYLTTLSGGACTDIMATVGTVGKVTLPDMSMHFTAVQAYLWPEYHIGIAWNFEPVESMVQQAESWHCLDCHTDVLKKCHEIRCCRLI